MKKFSLFLLSALLLTACSGGAMEGEEASDGSVEMTVEVEEDSSAEMMEDFEDARTMWAEVVEEGVEQDFDMAVLRMKGVYAKANYYVFNGKASEEMTAFMGELDGLLEAAEAGEFEMDFFFTALEEGLAEFDALLADM